jgi:hypothetical protein
LILRIKGKAGAVGTAKAGAVKHSQYKKAGVSRLSR